MEPRAVAAVFHAQDRFFPPKKKARSLAPRLPRLLLVFPPGLTLEQPPFAPLQKAQRFLPTAPARNDQSRRLAGTELEKIAPCPRLPDQLHCDAVLPGQRLLVLNSRR